MATKKKKKAKKKKKGTSNFPFYALFIALAVFIADLLSKYYVQAYLPVMDRYALWYPYYGIGIFENFLGIEFSINHAINRGAAWGILSDYQIYLLVFRIILIAFLVNYLLFFNKIKEHVIPLTLIAVGAAGNILDYYLYGHVIDMFHFIFWGFDYPIFNVADSAIFIGICWMLILSFGRDSKAKPLFNL